MSPKSQPEVVVRAAKPNDAPICGRICYDAFSYAKNGVSSIHHESISVKSSILIADDLPELYRFPLAQWN